jgi:hypothetical protein
MALKEYFGETRYNEIFNEIDLLVSEFEKLLKGTKLEIATHVFGKMKILEKGSNDLLEHMGDIVIENNGLQEENQMLKKDSKDLNKYGPEKYKKGDRFLISISDKKNIAKQYLWNKIRGVGPPQQGRSQGDPAERP